MFSCRMVLLDQAASRLRKPRGFLAAPRPLCYRWSCSGPDNFLDLPALIKQLGAALPPHPAVGAPISGEVVAEVTKVLQNTRLNPREWRQHAIFRRGRYTRNIVGYSPNQFVALLLCWERGQQSPIHDHSGAHCFIKMLSGQLKETHFRWAPDGSAGSEVDEEPVILDASAASTSVGFMHDSLGLHRIENPSAEEVAVSLHIYSPPFRECLVFPPTGGIPKTAPMVSIFSPESQWASNKHQISRAEEGPATTSLQEFCTALGNLPRKDGEAVDVHAVFDLLNPAEMIPMEWASFASPAHFSEFHPVQHIIHCDDEFSVIVTCWSPGQKVPPHTVGRGRKMWLKVLHGNLTFREYEAGLFPWESGVEHSKELAQGSASILEESSVRMHSIKNECETEPAVSIQVFSPPLTQFTYSNEAGVERRDVPRLMDRGFASFEGACPRALGRTAGRWYLSFKGLQTLLNQEFSRPDVSDAAISTLLSKAVFNPEEWRERLASALPPPAQWGSTSGSSVAPKHVVLAQESRYSILLSFWIHSSQEQCVVREQHQGRSWTLILEGELQERTYSEGTGEPALLRSSVLKEDGLSFVSGLSSQRERLERSHEADVPCISLHIYTPPLPEVA